MNEYWCIPPKENAEFVACMEDILHIYSLPYNKNLPVVCMDEKPYQLLGEAREPLEIKPGDVKKLDSEYIRCGISASVGKGPDRTGRKKYVIFSQKFIQIMKK